MNCETYLSLKQQVIDAGYGSEIQWQQNVTPPGTPEDFSLECMWVIVSSGMKNKIARIIEQRIKDALLRGRPVSEAFHHPGKSAAIQKLWDERDAYFQKFRSVSSQDILEFCGSLPWIGPITKNHLAKNCGVDCAKPDRHLIRIADRYNMAPQELCENLARETGDRIATVDIVLWRSAELGIVYEQI